MAIVTTNSQYYSDIAAAIRSKLGVSTQYRPDEMAAAIESIGAMPGIPVTVTGNPVIATDTLGGQRFVELKVYGKSTQDGTLSPENPVPIVSAGDSGSIALSITDDAEQNQSLTISTPNGLPGIPVESGGNFTDADGQQWICDVVDFGKNVLIQNVGKTVFDSNTVWGKNTNFQYYTKLDSKKYKDYCADCLCSNVPAAGPNKNPSIFINSYGDIRLNVTLEDDTVEGIKKFMNGAVFYAILATPIITPLPADELAAYRALHTYDGTTIISTNEDIAGLEVKYVAKAI